MSQHASLSPSRWRTFSVDQQLLMIANEMNRASKLMTSDLSTHRMSAYERTLQLTDLTIESQDRRAFRRELLRWRDLIAQLYLDGTGNPDAHSAALRCLLRFTPAVATQLAHLSMPDSVQVEEPS
jgi:hypothetical protein